MSILSTWLYQILSCLRSLIVISLVCVLISWSFPAHAASYISPQLERQVLEIIREHPEALLESLQVYQQQQLQKLQQTRQAFVQDLKTSPLKVISESPITGSPQAKILLIEFSDFQCPFCATAHDTLKTLIAKYQDEVSLVYKHFPIASIHSEAIPAAKAAWAAFQQGKFWEYHDVLFTHQNELGEKLYLDTAKNLNLDLQKFEQDRSIADTAIQKDIDLAEKLQLGGTPFFVIKSETFSGSVQLSDIEKILSQERQESGVKNQES